jgi:hypothetical protein
MAAGEPEATHFDWSGPHDRAVRRARAAFFLVVGVLAAYCAAVVIAVLVCVSIAVTDPHHGLSGAEIWAFVAGGLVLYVAAAIVIAMIGHGGRGRSIRALAGARPPTDNEAGAAQNSINDFTVARGIPSPELWLVDNDAPNGLAFGTPQHGNVCITTGALRLSKPELEALCASLITAITMPACVYAMSAADLLFLCGVATSIVWYAAVFVLLSLVVGAPPVAVAATIVAIVVLIATTQPLLFVTRHFMPTLLDEVAELCDLETVRCTAQPASLGTLLVHLAEDDSRVSTPVAIEHRWFERDVLEVQPRHGFFMGSITALFDSDSLLAGAARKEASRPALTHRAEVAAELADSNPKLIARINRAKQLT